MRYEVTENVYVIFERPVYQIRALVDFWCDGELVRAGDWGGYVVRERANVILPQAGTGWAKPTAVLLGGVIENGLVRGGMIAGGNWSESPYCEQVHPEHWVSPFNEYAAAVGCLVARTVDILGNYNYYGDVNDYTAEQKEAARLALERVLAQQNRLFNGNK